MHCCKCGTRVGNDAEYCHKCGASVYTSQEKLLAERRQQQCSQIDNPKDRSLVEELLNIDADTTRCHACGQKENLSFWDFGLGKPISAKRDWTQTALSIAISAATIPLAGVGVVRLPSRSIELSVFRLKLVLCSGCYQQRRGYEAHPFWAALRRHGYTEFISAEVLGASKSANLS